MTTDDDLKTLFGNMGIKTTQEQLNSANRKISELEKQEQLNSANRKISELEKQEGLKEMIGRIAKEMGMIKERMKREEVFLGQAGKDAKKWVRVGKGEITIDTAAEESVCLRDWGDC